MIKQLPEMKVELLGYSMMGLAGPDEIIATIKQLETSEKLETIDSKLVKELMDDIGSRDKILDGVAFTFGIENVSRVSEIHKIRHRTASYSIQSGRYVDRTGKVGVMPDTIKNDDEARELVEEAETDSLYSKLLKLGIPEQDARYYSFQNTPTYIVQTMTARSLLHFFKERLCNKTQDETHGVALKELELASQVAPLLMSKAGPHCKGKGCIQRKSCEPEKREELFRTIDQYFEPEIEPKVFRVPKGPLLAYTRLTADFLASPEVLCAAAGKGCYSSKPAGEIIQDYLDGEPYKKTLKTIVVSGHESVIEHAHFAFEIDVEEFLDNPPWIHSYDKKAGVVFLNARSVNEYLESNPGKRTSQIIEREVKRIAPRLLRK